MESKPSMHMWPKFFHGDCRERLERVQNCETSGNVNVVSVLLRISSPERVSHLLADILGEPNGGEEARDPFLHRFGVSQILFRR